MGAPGLDRELPPYKDVAFAWRFACIPKITFHISESSACSRISTAAFRLCSNMPPTLGFSFRNSSLNSAVVFHNLAQGIECNSFALRNFLGG